MSLRPLAAALNTSDRMLIYYFESRDQLVAAIAVRAAEGLVAALPRIDPAKPPQSARTWLDRCWAVFADPNARPAMALLFELDALAVRSSGPLRDATQAVTQTWIADVEGVLAALRVPTRGRRALARVVAASLIGLMLEALTATEPTRPGPEFAILANLIDGQHQPH